MNTNRQFGDRSIASLSYIRDQQELPTVNLNLNNIYIRPFHVDAIIKPANSNNVPMRCSFCEKSKIKGHTTHNLRDNLHRLTCPELRKRVCTHCFAFGDNAHTNKHCPKRKRDNKELMIRQHFHKSQ